MNNDVLRLATKAGFYVSDGKIYSPTTNDDLSALMQKFAEAMALDVTCTIGRKIPRKSGDDSSIPQLLYDIQQQFKDVA